MTVNPLPPQAYTKETLQKAYTWLLTQSASVKDMATSQDMLVSMYLKAQRNGDASLETPSIQNFKQELKSLAHLIGDLQTPTTNTHAQQRPPMPQTFIQPILTGQNTTASVPTAPNVPPSGLNSSLNITLDQQSLLALAEVRQTLNLSSDTEALRALISLGYRQFKKI